jgi:hypothetical protein
MYACLHTPSSSCRSLPGTMPFVMTSREEIEQALDDYRHGRLTA